MSDRSQSTTGLSSEEMRIWERLVDSLREAGQDRLPTRAEFQEWMEDSQSSAQSTQNADSKPTNAPHSWQEIELAFLSDERVEVYSGGNRKTFNYDELGFEDRRNGKQNSAWVMLRELAKKGGAMPRPQAGTPRAMAQKRIEEIREKLRKHFRIEADPIPFNGNTYQASFKIMCRPSFKT